MEGHPRRTQDLQKGPATQPALERPAAAQARRERSNTSARSIPCFLSATQVEQICGSPMAKHDACARDEVSLSVLFISLSPLSLSTPLSPRMVAGRWFHNDGMQAISQPCVQPMAKNEERSKANRYVKNLRYAAHRFGHTGQDSRDSRQPFEDQDSSTSIGHQPRCTHKFGKIPVPR